MERGSVVKRGAEVIKSDEPANNGKSGLPVAPPRIPVAGALKRGMCSGIRP